MLGQTPPRKVQPGSPEMMRADVDYWRESVGMSHIRTSHEYQREQQKKFNEALWRSAFSTPAVVWTPRIVDVPKRIAATAHMPMSAWPGQFEAKRGPAKPVDWRKGLKWTGYFCIGWGAMCLFSPVPGTALVVLGLGGLMIWPAWRRARKENEEFDKLFGRASAAPKWARAAERWRTRARKKQDEVDKTKAAELQARFQNGLEGVGAFRGYYLQTPAQPWPETRGVRRGAPAICKGAVTFGSATKESQWRVAAIGSSAWTAEIAVQLENLII